MSPDIRADVFGAFSSKSPLEVTPGKGYFYPPAKQKEKRGRRTSTIIRRDRILSLKNVLVQGTR